MRWQRRGFRRGTNLKPREQITVRSGEIKKTPPMGWEEFFEQIIPLLRPNEKRDGKAFSAMYRQFTPEDQKKLTHKIAGQILFAHPNVVQEILKRLSGVSLDLGQQTEVEYRRLQLVDHFF